MAGDTVLTYDKATLDTALALKSPALAPQAASTSGTLVVNGMNYITLATSQSRAMPTAPADKSLIWVTIDSFTSPAVLTLTTGGSDVFDQGNGVTATSTTLNLGQGQIVCFQYDAVADKYRRLFSHVPTTILQSLFASQASHDSLVTAVNAAFAAADAEPIFLDVRDLTNGGTATAAANYGGGSDSYMTLPASGGIGRIFAKTRLPSTWTAVKISAMVVVVDNVSATNTVVLTPETKSKASGDTASLGTAGTPVNYTAPGAGNQYKETLITIAASVTGWVTGQAAWKVAITRTGGTGSDNYAGALGISFIMLEKA